MKLSLLPIINKYFNYVFYPFFAATGLFILTLMLTQSATFTTYSTNEGDYRNVLDIYNFSLAAILLLKYFLQELEDNKGSLFTIVINNIPFIIVNIFFFILFFINNSLEDTMLTQINSIEQNSVPLYIFFYATSLYFIYSNYQSAHAAFQEIKQHESPATILYDVIQSTEGSVIHFLVLCVALFITKKTPLVTYVINHINTAFLFIAITSTLFFIVLWIRHKTKKSNK
jgi:hypothetical protein